MPQSITTKKYFLTINLVYFTLVFSLVGFGSVSFYLAGQIAIDPETSMLYKYILVVLIPAGFFIGGLLYKKQLSTIKESELKQKLFKYQGAVLIRAACTEVPGMVAAVATVTTGDISLLIFTAIATVLLILFRPNPQTLLADAPFSDQETVKIEDPEAILYEGEK